MDEGPDKGRAWLVAFAGFIINMISAGIYRAQGLLFVSFMQTFHIDRRKAAVPFSIRMAVRNLLAPIIGILGQKYGASAMVISGGLLGTLSSVLCVFAPDLAWITFFWGCLYGLATALITVLPQIVISQYFIKHRTTATGLSFSGGCMGSLAFPAILEYLLHNYGLHGTFFILGGIIMHVIPAAMIIKSPPWCKREKKKVPTSEKVINSTTDKDKARNNLKGQLCERGIQVGNDFHDNYEQKRDFKEIDSILISRKRSQSCNGLTYKMNNLARSTTVPSMSTLGMNYKTISSYPEHIFDIDLDYLKQNCDLLFHMMSMEIPNMEISYRAILLEVEQDDLWHPDKNEIMQEIESLYKHIEKTLEIDPVSNKKVRANGLYIKKTLISGTLTMSKKSESLRVVRRYFRTYRERGLLHLGKIRSAPNFSNIYNELARKDYVLSKLKQLCNSNEIRIISHLCQYNPKDVLKVLFQIRTLYRIYNDLEATNNFEASEICEPRESLDSDEGISIIHKSPSSKQNEIPTEEHNNFKTHIKTALKLHTNAIFLLLVCTRTAFFLSFTPVITIIVDFAMDRGLPEEDGKYIIGALAFGDLLGRIGLGWITDRGYASLPRYMFVALFILSLCTVSIPLMYSRWSIFCAIALFGMIQGSMFIRHPVLVVKYLSPHQHSIAMGCMEFSSGVICFLVPIYIGYFRDTLGTYDPIFYINGIIVFLAGIAWLFEPKMAKNNEQVQKSP